MKRNTHRPELTDGPLVGTKNVCGVGEHDSLFH